MKTDYYGIETDFVLAIKSEAKVLELRDVAAENEDWQFMDEIDVHLRLRRKHEATLQKKPTFSEKFFTAANRSFLGAPSRDTSGPGAPVNVGQPA